MSILLLHGFTGHPDDLKPLQQALHNNGFDSFNPALPGHGSTPEELNQIRAEDWLRSVRSQPADILIGLSMGGLLSTILAAEVRFKKIILLSPAFFLQFPGRLGVCLAEHGLGRWWKSFHKSAGRDIENPVQRFQSKAYPEIPINALAEFEKIRRQALGALPQVKCPIFSFFGAHDHTVDVKKSSALFEHPTILSNSAHILPLDYDQEELIQRCLSILEK